MHVLPHSKLSLPCPLACLCAPHLPTFPVDTACVTLCDPPAVSRSKFLARNIPLERLLKEYREEHPVPSGSECTDKEHSCDMAGDQLGSGDLEDMATQTCADSYIKLDPEATAVAAVVAAQAAVAAAASEPAAGCAVSPAVRCSPTSSTDSEQCGMTNSTGHADAMNDYCQVSASCSCPARCPRVCTVPTLACNDACVWCRVVNLQASCCF
jgi:hypothetical protein